MYQDDESERWYINQADIAAIDKLVVILGDPGLGKTILAQVLGALSDLICFVHPRFHAWLDPRRWSPEMEAATHGESATRE